jgi:hypothetical protein
MCLKTYLVVDFILDLVKTLIHASELGERKISNLFEDNAIKKGAEQFQYFDKKTSFFTHALADFRKIIDCQP